MNEVRDQISDQGRRDSGARKAGNLTLDTFVEKQLEAGKYSGQTEGQIYESVIESSGRPGGAVNGGAKIASAIGRYAPAVGKGLLVLGAVQDTASLASAVNQSIRTGDVDIAGREAARITGGWTGAWAGAKVTATAGAAIGAAMGAPFAGVGAGPGAAIGGFIGGLAGGIAGYWGGSKAGTYLYNNGRQALRHP
jgi:hypothetical protein